MMVFQIPEGTITDVHSLMMSFWWGQKANERRIHWINRQELLARKADEGMGFRDMRGFNIALLSKQLWNLSQRPQSLVGRIPQAKYHKHSSIWKQE
ncbi:Uncharacterized mitochondrial protein AtMg00310 [Linum grandiflorum]